MSCRCDMRLGPRMDKSTVSADGPRTKGGGSAIQRIWAGLLAASDAAPRKKPATLSYGREEVPPAVVTWMSAVQHVGVIAIFLVYPLIIARQAGLTPDRTVLIAGDMRFSYAEMSGLSHRLAGAMLGAGLEQQARSGGCSQRVGESMRLPAMISACCCGYSGCCCGSP